MDYLLNIEEVTFEDGHEQLEVDSWGWPEQRMIDTDYSWQPTGGWNAVGKKLASGVQSFTESWARLPTQVIGVCRMVGTYMPILLVVLSYKSVMQV